VTPKHGAIARALDGRAFGQASTIDTETQGFLKHIDDYALMRWLKRCLSRPSPLLTWQGGRQPIHQLIPIL
jgi:hypothetical protein